MRDGLYQKYVIQKTDGSPVDPGAAYFVLRLDAGGDPAHVAACRDAALAYAASIRPHLPQLAADLEHLCGATSRPADARPFPDWRTP